MCRWLVRKLLNISQQILIIFVSWQHKAELSKGPGGRACPWQGEKSFHPCWGQFVSEMILQLPKQALKMCQNLGVWENPEMLISDSGNHLQGEEFPDQRDSRLFEACGSLEQELIKVWPALDASRASWIWEFCSQPSQGHTYQGEIRQQILHGKQWWWIINNYN